MKKKIAFFGIKTYPAFAGADRVVENIINTLDDEFDIYIYLKNCNEKISSSGNKHFIYLPCLKGKHLSPFTFFCLCTLHMIFKENYDLIHAHNSDVGLFTYLLKLKYNGRIMGTFHGNPYESTKWGTIAKWYLKVSEGLFLKSCHKLTTVCRSKIVSGKEIVFIPNGVEEIEASRYTDHMNASINYEKLKIQKGNYILFASGRLDRRKGLHHLLNAYESGAITDPLVIISDFSHDQAYSKSIDTQIYNLQKKNLVVLKKLLPKNDLFDVIKNAKLVVFPSEIEAMSMFVLEVIACGTTLISSDIEPNIEIVGHDYKYLFKSKDVDSLSTTVKNALNDIDTDAVPGNILRKPVIPAKYRWRTIVNDYCCLYRSFFKC